MDVSEMRVRCHRSRAHNGCRTTCDPRVVAPDIAPTKWPNLTETVVPSVSLDFYDGIFFAMCNGVSIQLLPPKGRNGQKRC